MKSKSKCRTNLENIREHIIDVMVERAITVKRSKAKNVEKKCRRQKCRQINVEATLTEEINADHIKCRKIQDFAMKRISYIE
jgi:hypothetical protein